MSAYATLPFQAQRLTCLALVFGMTTFAIIAGMMLQASGGEGMLEEPIEDLDSATLIVGGTVAVIAMVVRRIFNKRADAAPGPQRAKPRFLARLIPLILLEIGCLLAITTWALNGTAVPGLATACVLLSLAIALLPLRDVDADVH